MKFSRYFYLFLVTLSYCCDINALTIVQRRLDRFSKQELETFIRTNVQKGVPIEFQSPVVKANTAVKLGITETQLDRMLSGKAEVSPEGPVISKEAVDLKTAGEQKSDRETIDALGKLRQKLTTMGGQEDLLRQLDGVEKAFKEKAADRWNLLNTFWDDLLAKRGEGVPGGPPEKEEGEEEPEVIFEVVLNLQDPLVVVDLGRLSAQDKQNSDAEFVKALKDISQEFFIWFDGWDAQTFNEKMKGLIGTKKLESPQEFVSIFDMYTYYMRNYLTNIGAVKRVGSPKFKKTDELRLLIGLPSVQITQEYREYKGDDFITAIQGKIGANLWPFIEAQTQAIEQELLDNLDTLVATVENGGAKVQKKKSIEVGLRVLPGTLGEFVYATMYKGAKDDGVFLEPLYAMFQKGPDENEVIRGLIDVLRPCVFNEDVLKSDEAKRVIEGMAINIIAGQRALAKMNEKDWKPVGLSELQEQESDLEVQDLFEKLMREVGDKELNEEGFLDKDYGQQLYVDLNRLRINPDFHRFFGMLGQQVDKKNDEQDPGRFFALFTLLFYDTNPAMIDYPVVIKNITKQLLFIVDSLQDVIGTWGQPKEAFKRLVIDRRNRVLLTATVNPYTFLNSKIRPDSTYKQVIKAVADLQKRMKNKGPTRQVLEALKKERLDSKKIVDFFKNLTGKDVADFNRKITTIVQEHIKKLQVPNAAIKMITEAGKNFKATKTYVDRTLKNEFEAAFGNYKLISEKVYNNYYQNLFGIVRTPETVARAFTSLVVDVPKIARLITDDEKILEINEARKVLVNWVAPYGLLNQVFLSVKEEGKSSQAALKALTIALTALNKAHLPIGEKRKELPQAVINDATTINLGGYEDKLGAMIKHVTDDYDVEAIIADIGNFVKAANIELEETIDYKRVVVDIRVFLITIMGSSILETLKALDSRELHYNIPKLSIDSNQEKDRNKVKRNIKIYKRIQEKHLLAPLITLLSLGDIINKLQQLDLIVLDQTIALILESIKEIESVDAGVSQIIKEFIEDLAKKLKLLKKATVALAEDKKTLEEAEKKAPEALPVPEKVGPEPPPPPPPPMT